MSAPFERIRIPFSTLPVALEVGGLTAIEFAGATPKGMLLHFTPPAEDPTLRFALEVHERRVVPCVEASRVWLVWPGAGSADLDPVCELLLWRTAHAAHVNIGSSVRTFADGHFVEFLAANQNRTIQPSAALAYNIHVQKNGNYTKGTLEVAARFFEFWATAPLAFRVLLYTQDFAGALRQVRHWDSAATDTGGHALEIQEQCPALGWQLTAYSLTGAVQVSAFTFVCATTS